MPYHRRLGLYLSARGDGDRLPTLLGRYNHRHNIYFASKPTRLYSSYTCAGRSCCVAHPSYYPLHPSTNCAGRPLIMVNTRIYIKKTRKVSSYDTQTVLKLNVRLKTRLIGLRGRVYPSRDARPSHLLIDTRCPENKWEPRYPVAEGHFPDACLQPYVHSCMVNICEGRQEYSLALFFKNHVRLPVNTSLAACKGNPRRNPFPILSYGIRSLSGRPVLFPSGLHPGLPDFVRIPFVCTRVHCPSHSTSGLGSIWHSDVCILTVVYIAVLWRGEIP